MASQHSERARYVDRERNVQSLPPIRTYLGTELALPLPWHRLRGVHSNPNSPVMVRAEPLAGLQADTRALAASPPLERRPATSSSRPLRAPTSQPPELTPSQSQPSVTDLPPAYAYNVLRPSRHGGLITTVPTARSRARQMPQHLSILPRPESDPQPQIANKTVDAIAGASEKEKVTRRHACPVCAKRFSRPSILKTHMSVHTGSRPFMCPYQGCTQVFSVVSNMRRHYLRTHSDGMDGDSIEGWDDGSNIAPLEHDRDYKWMDSSERP